MISARPRFTLLPRALARLILVALLVWIGFGVTAVRAPGPGAHLVATDHSDTALYKAIVRGTAAGGATPAAYYRAAAAEQRARGYPLRPFVTVREPALALVSAWAGGAATDLGYRLLALAALVTLALRLRGAGSVAERIGATALASLSIVAIASPVMAVWHEAWAALLLVLALANAGGRRWPLALVAGLAAVLVRELAAPVLVALLIAALAERRRAEAIGWAAVLLLFAGAMALHAHAVAHVVLPGDRASPGWDGLGGWRFILTMTRQASVFALLPAPLTAALVPLALIGWAGRGGAFADRVTLALAALIVPFMAIGRPDNFYWGLLIAPLLPIGLAFAPRALRDLVRSARQAGGGAAWHAPWTADASS